MEKDFLPKKDSKPPVSTHVSENGSMDKGENKGPQPNVIQQLQALPEAERPKKLQPNTIQKIQRKKDELKKEEGKLQKKEDPSALKEKEEKKIQKKSAGEKEKDTEPFQLKPASSGTALPGDVRTKMESSLGADFSDVKVHQDQNAEKVGAHAYTQGKDIHFAGGQYNPDTAAGQELIGHELTHVIQQQEGRVPATGQTHGVAVNDDPSLEREADEMGKKAASQKEVSLQPGHKRGSLTSADNNAVQRKAKAVRFQEDPDLDSVSEGKSVLQKGSTGIAVVKMQQALCELGYLSSANVSGTIDDVTVAAVKQLQTAEKFSAAEIDGKINQKVFDVLDGKFLDYSVEADVLKKQTAPVAPSTTEWSVGSEPKELLKNTRSLNDTERKGIADAISTAQTVSPVTGTLPAFKETTSAGKYGDRIKSMVNKVIDWQFDRLGKGKGALRKDTKNLHSWGDIEKVASKSKEETDKVFGAYAVRSSFKAGTNLFDGWEDKEKKMKASKAFEDGAADWRVEKILTGDKNIKQIDKEHGAIQSRSAEAAIIKSIKAEIVKKRRAELLEIHKGWPGYTGEGKVYLQRFKDTDNSKNRDFMWHNFKMIIHEYIHTLEHSEHVKYRGKMDQQAGGFTLREGVTDYFTKIAFNHVNLNDKALRATVEGPFHDPKVTHPVGTLTTYGESENAERLSAIVGLRNLCAAFFLGHTELIGKK